MHVEIPGYRGEMDDDTILSLHDAALAMEDLLTVAICCRALSGMVPYRVWLQLTPAERIEVGEMNDKVARQRCKSWLRGVDKDGVVTIGRCQIPTSRITFAKGTPHK